MESVRAAGAVICAFCFSEIAYGSKRLATASLQSYHSACYRRRLADEKERALSRLPRRRMR